MLSLLNLLAAIALLVWGTHIVRTGILRAVRRQPAPRAARAASATAAAPCSPGSASPALIQRSTATALIVAVVRRPGPDHAPRRRWR